MKISRATCQKDVTVMPLYTEIQTKFAHMTTNSTSEKRNKRKNLIYTFNTRLNGELHVLYSSPDIIRQIKSRRMRWAGHVSRVGEGRNVYRVLVGKPEGKKPLEKPRRRWKDAIKMDVRSLAGEGVWSGFTWLRIGTGGGLL
jgi:hypothetical protein